jgi:hypothetical protein
MRSMVVTLRSSSTCNWPNLSMYTGRPILSVLWWKWGYSSFIASLSGNWKVCHTERTTPTSILEMQEREKYSLGGLHDVVVAHRIMSGSAIDFSSTTKLHGRKSRCE